MNGRETAPLPDDLDTARLRAFFRSLARSLVVVAGAVRHQTDAARHIHRKQMDVVVLRPTDGHPFAADD
jgi:hypothetical protein